MKLIKQLTLFTLLFLCSTSFAQTNPVGQCGVLTQMQDIDRLLENKLRAKETNPNQKRTTSYIPIKLHLVARTNGQGRISEIKALEGICKLNEYFEPLDMQFYLKGDFNYIDNDAMYDLEYPNIPNSVRFLYNASKVAGAANVFIGNGLSSGNSGYYSSSQDIIYMDRQYVNSRDNILAHEFGHFFSLAHTFYGWEAIPDDPDGMTAPKQINGIEVEYVDRNKNCEDAADRFCDTPADYNQNWGGGCNYTGGAMDPDSVLIDPDEKNLMAYYSFTGCSEYYFAADQMATIKADYENRTEISDLPNPVAGPVISFPNLITPANDVVVDPLKEVVFEWEKVPNATRYLIEVSPLPGFTFLEHKAFVTDNSFRVPSLNPNRAQFYWRVWALNDVYFCDVAYSDVSVFKVGDPSPAIDFSLTEKLDVFPNPSKGELNIQFVNISLPSEYIDIEFFDLSGKNVYSLKEQAISKGENSISLSLNSIEQGVYFFNIISEGKIVGREKIIRL